MLLFFHAQKETSWGLSIASWNPVICLGSFIAAFARLLGSRLSIRTKESPTISFFIVINLLERTKYLHHPDNSP
jgi:hypothetical protein